MQASSSFRQAFLKNMLMGLQRGRVSSKGMSILERKRAIKLSADVAMAIARDGTNWSHALVSDLSKKEKNKVLMRNIFGKDYERLIKPCFTWKVERSKKILRRSFRASLRIRKRVKARILARSLVKKRIRVLKSLIPGGESLDDSSLLDESLDYVIALQAQVNLMWLLARDLGVSNLNSLH